LQSFVKSQQFVPVLRNLAAIAALDPTCLKDFVAGNRIESRFPIGPGEVNSWRWPLAASLFLADAIPCQPENG
jgi:hypothetical protein